MTNPILTKAQQRELYSHLTEARGILQDIRNEMGKPVATKSHQGFLFVNKHHLINK